MITCIINGMAAYPAANQSVKITYANQYVTDDGEYSYDISFPMSIVDNRRVFHNVSRFDVRKNTQKYDDCKLYVGGRLILSGVGTIISVSDSEVKLQIVGGKSRIKYNSKLEKVYIDEMELGRANHDSTLSGDGIERVPGFLVTEIIWQNDTSIAYKTASYSPYIGVAGQYVYVPTRDETNSLTANLIVGKKGERYVFNPAVHPNLMYIFHRVLSLLGYTVVRNDFNRMPWNELYIASAYKTDEFRHALPHWTAYTFIEEFRKLFNAKIYFDDTGHTVSVIGSSEMCSGEAVELEPLDEYSVDYDEEGSLNTIDTSNVSFNLGDSSVRTEYECLPQKVLAHFEVYTYQGMQPNLDAKIQSWDLKRRRTTILKRVASDGSLQAYYVWRASESDDTQGTWFECGTFSPLVRRKDSDNEIKLNIAPAAVTYREEDFTLYLLWAESLTNDPQYIRPRYMLSVTNDKEAEAENTAKDEEGYSYVTVEDALADESSMDDEENEDACLPIYFLSDKLHDPTPPFPSDMSTLLPQSCICDNAMGDHAMAWPIPVTDDVHLRRVFGVSKGWSLSLVQKAAHGLSEFHAKALIDDKNCMEIKFRHGSIPDPSKIYIFHGKKFVCSKIELNVKNEEIDPIYTGYFYMMS